jgi:hypothetical protein
MSGRGGFWIRFFEGAGWALRCISLLFFLRAGLEGALLDHD